MAISIRQSYIYYQLVTRFSDIASLIQLPFSMTGFKCSSHHREGKTMNTITIHSENRILRGLLTAGMVTLALIVLSGCATDASYRHRHHEPSVSVAFEYYYYPVAISISQPGKA